MDLLKFGLFVKCSSSFAYQLNLPFLITFEGIKSSSHLYELYFQLHQLRGVRLLFSVFVTFRALNIYSHY